jgi:hypothetical protein
MIKRVFERVMDTIHDADAYGRPITLNYNRRIKFKTKLGGLGTIILGGFMAVYFSFLFWGLFARSTINYTATTEVEDLTQNPEVFNLGKSGFKISVGLSTSSYSLFDDEIRKYLELVVVESELIRKPDGNWVNNVRNLELKKCGDSFPYNDKDIVNDFNLDEYICITSDDFQIAGNWYSKYSKMIFIEIRPWSNFTYSSCETQENIFHFVRNNEIEVVYLDNYFDTRSFDTPIKSFITQKYSYGLLQYNSKFAKMLIRENKIELMDSVFQYQNYNKTTFYSISDERVDIGDLNTYYFRARISPDSHKVTHTRTVFSLFDMLAQIGGVYNVLSSISFLIFWFYAEKMMYYWVLRKSYQFNSKEETDMPVYTEDDKRHFEESKKDDPVLNPFKSKVCQCKKRDLKNFSTLSSDPGKYFQNSNMCGKGEKMKYNFSPKQCNYLGDKMKQRRRFDYSTWDFLYGTFWWVKRKYPWCRKDGKSVHDNYILFRKGLEKFHVDLDLVTIITTVRRMKVFTDLLFNDNQKLLERYSKHHTIESANFDDLDEF